MLSIQPDEITSILKEQIKKYERELTDTSTGTVLSVGDGIARIYGLEQAKAGELLSFRQRHRGHGIQPGRRQRRCCYLWQWPYHQRGRYR